MTAEQVNVQEKEAFLAWRRDLARCDQSATGWLALSCRAVLKCRGAHTLCKVWKNPVIAV